MGKEEFFEKCKEVGEVAKKMESPLIVNHYDADGISSGSIAAIWLRDAGRKYQVKTVRKLGEEEVASLDRKRETIFVDLGGSCKEIDEFDNAVVIDHHQTKGLDSPQANPHLHGIDGGREISAAGVAYFVFGSSVGLAIVGAVGDMQYPLQGLNREILERAEKEGKVECKNDLRLFGRFSRPLSQLLLYSDDPYLPGITGNEDAVNHLIDESGVEAKKGGVWRTYDQLSNEEKKRFVSAVVEYLAERGRDKIAKRLIGEVYVLKGREGMESLKDASEFSTILNACGRNDRPDIGMGVCMGEEWAYHKARELLALHRRNLREGIEYANRHVEDYGDFLFLDGRGKIDDGIIGVVAGMVYGGGGRKPVIAVAIDRKENIKVSARGTKKLVEDGLNLGEVMKSACEKVEGVGGGHNIAAGATIGKDVLNEFLIEVAKSI